MSDQATTTHTPSNPGILKRARIAAPAAAISAVLALGLGACGSDGSPSTSSAGTTAASTDMSAGDFILELEDQKQATIEQVVAANPECEGLTTDRDLLLYISAKATDLKPDEPIEPTILDSCTP